MNILTFFGLFAIVAMIVTVCSRGLCETHKKSTLIARVIGISLTIAALVFSLATVVSGLGNGSCAFVIPKFQDITLAVSLSVTAVAFVTVVLGAWCNEKAEKEKTE